MPGVSGAAGVGVLTSVVEGLAHEQNACADETFEQLGASALATCPTCHQHSLRQAGGSLSGTSRASRRAS